MSELDEAMEKPFGRKEQKDNKLGLRSLWFNSEVQLQKSIDEQRAIKASNERNSDDDNPHCKIYAIPAQEGSNKKFNIFELLYILFERVVAIVMLVITLPIMLVEWVLVRLDSPGSPLFIQPRVTMSKIKLGSELLGKDYLQAVDDEFKADEYYYEPTLFRFIKFRSMYIDAKQRFPELYDYNFSRDNFLDNQFKYSDDPRVTRIGKYIRRLTIDEFPNFWSVLMGDMRLVGPRPELPGLLQCYTPELMKKFTVKPGITGYAQINGRGDLGFRDTIAYDLKYIEERTIWLDIQILFKTFWLVILRRGAF